MCVGEVRNFAGVVRNAQGCSGSRAEMVDNETLPTLEPDLGNASVGKRPGAISKRVLLRVTNSPE